MNIPAFTLLDLWETGATYSNAARPAALLAISTGESIDVAALLPLGQRDAGLLKCYEYFAGNHLTALTNCRECESSVELDFETNDVSYAVAQDVEVCVKEEGWELNWRLPNTVDFCHAAEAGAIDAAKKILLDRCLTSFSDEPKNSPPEHLVAKLMHRAATVDPQSEAKLDIICPDCGSEWHVPFEIGAYFWSCIQTEALRLISEVSQLAETYSWSEAEILAMSPARRSAYLQLAR
jgi:hypothetical protein